MLKKQGKIITNFGERISVKLDNGEMVDCSMRSQFKGDLTVGDNVEIDFIENTTPVISKLLPRKNLISRPNQYQRKNKNIAANIDQAIILITHNPAPIEHYIDRYLAALHKADITPIIVVNKIDEQTTEDKLKIDSITNVYKNIGYSVYYISALLKTNIPSFVENALENKTSIFLGQSGVGKSETLNAIIGKNIAETNEVSNSNKKGRHTTTCSTLYEINENTNIIDSPGIREFGLWDITKEDLFDGFLEFKKLKGMCKFRNCPHEENSLGCEIVRRVKEGDISPLRYRNYHRILKEIN